MSDLSRREFLRRATRTGLAVGLGAQFGGLTGCGGDAHSVDQPSGGYDAIVVGGGTAGAIAAAKLQLASGGKKRILIIEAGGPTSAAIGGTAYPPWLPPGRRDLTIYPGIYLPDTPAGAADTTLMTQAVFNMIQLFAQDPGLKIVWPWPIALAISSRRNSERAAPKARVAGPDSPVL